MINHHNYQNNNKDDNLKINYRYILFSTVTIISIGFIISYKRTIKKGFLNDNKFLFAWKALGYGTVLSLSSSFFITQLTMFLFGIKDVSNDFLFVYFIKK
jgi:hypothetical protein